MSVECPRCNAEAEETLTFIEGLMNTAIPSGASSVCIEVEPQSRNEAEVTLYFHGGGYHESARD